MSVYTVHEPPLRRYDTAGDPDRFVFVRDGFSFWAFLLGPLWMIRHRMWLVLIGYLLLVGGMQFVTGWPEGVLLLLGLFATSLLLGGVFYGGLAAASLGRAHRLACPGCGRSRSAASGRAGSAPRRCRARPSPARR